MCCLRMFWQNSNTSAKLAWPMAAATLLAVMPGSSGQETKKRSTSAAIEARDGAGISIRS